MFCESFLICCPRYVACQDFMVALRKRCDEVGAVLIFDEAGFRDGSEGVGPKDCPNLANLAPSLKAPLNFFLWP